MKNLKKVLSLVLALAMALSLMTVAFAKDASDFADYSKVDFNEAVDVMVAAGVFDGVENNNFDPTAVLTREQAAKIVTYMIIGADAADKLTTTVAPYADVAANRWSAGAIAWCTERGILAGSNGKFDPTGKLTGLAFSKMLLVALGYDAEIEKLVGGTWAINAATLAISNDLDKGLEGIALGSVLTREQACQMAFNTMKADLVKYDSKGTNITLSDGTNVVVGASSAEPYQDNNATNAALGTPTITQFAEKYCQKLRLEGTSNDAFGRPATEWSYNGSSIGTYAKSATTSYEGTVTKGTLYSLLGSSIADKTEYYERTDTTKPYKLTVWVDGVKQVVNASDYLASGSSATAGATAKGATTEVFVDSDAKTITVAIVNTYVAQAAADYSTANKALAVIDRGGHGITSIKNEDFAVSEYVEDDYILYTYDAKAGKVKSIEKAEVVTGTVGTYVKGATGYVTVGGTKYNYSATIGIAAVNGGSAANFVVGEEATVVLDKQGNVIVVDALAAVNENYVFVQSVGSGDARDTYVIADLTSIEGKESTATLKQITIDGSEKKTVSEMKTAMPANAAGWFTYTISSDKYKLSADTSKQHYAVATSGEKLVENGSITIGKSSSPAVAGKANSKTVFVIKDADDNVAVYEGIAKVPTIASKTGNTTYAYYYNGDDNYAKYVYIDVADTATIDDKTASNDDVFYILKQSGKVVAADDNEYYTLDVLKNGEVVKLDVAVDAKDLADSEGKIVYKLKTNSKNQGASATEVVLNSDPTTCKLVDDMRNYYVSYSNNVLNLKDSSTDKHNLVLADDAVIYVVLKDANLMADPAADYEVQTLTAKQLAGFLNGRTVTGAVTGFTTASDSNTYKTIYMTIINSVEF